jgi:hypothetical protein
MAEPPGFATSPEQAPRDANASWPEQLKKVREPVDGGLGVDRSTQTPFARDTHARIIIGST